MMEEKRSCRKTIRLERSVYEMRGLAVSVTLGAHGKQALFTDSALCSGVINFLRDSMKAYEMDILAFCLMPTHLHVVLHNLGGRSIILAIRDFKQRTYHRSHCSLWQRSFYDHFIRKDEELRKAMEYIVNNPVRAGLVSKADDYPWTWPRYGTTAPVPLQ